MHLIAPTVPHSPAIPTHLLLFYGIGNVTLNFLNFFWFRAMVRAVRKRFVVQPQPGSGSQADADKADLKKIATGKQGIKVDVKGSGDEPFEKEARVGKHEKKDL